MTDEEFVHQLEACSLPPAEFNHGGHVRLAWNYLQRHSLDEAVAATCVTIQLYAGHLGAHGKFHHTITAALVALMHAGGAGDRSVSWDAFRDRNAALLDDARGALGRHYSPGALATEEARLGFVEPDLAPLP